MRGHGGLVLFPLAVKLILDVFQLLAHSGQLSLRRFGSRAQAYRSRPGLIVRAGCRHGGGGGSRFAGLRARQPARKVVGKGYRNANLLGTDSVLSPLREREDFKKPLEELENESPAKPEKTP